MKRILVVLPNWLGETLFATPFLRALRGLRPDAFIATLGWPQCREVLMHNPWIDELLSYDERGADRGLGGAWRLAREVRRRRFDAAFVLRRSLSRTLLLRLAGIPVRIGFANAKSGWLLTRRIQAPKEVLRHKALSYLPLLGEAGDAAGRWPCEYVVSPEERRGARELLASHHIDGDLPLVVMHPGANWTHKRWAPERFAALGDRLSAARPVQIAVTGGPSDAALAEAIGRRMRHPAALLAGRTTVRQLGACLECARLVIANDTGVLHVAAALSRPIVALYGPTSPAITGPLGAGRLLAVLHHESCCPAVPCYRPDHPGYPGMDAITVEEVCEAALRMLEQG